MRICADDVRRLRHFSTCLLEELKRDISTPEARAEHFQVLEHLSTHLSSMAGYIEETRPKKVRR